MKENYIHKIQFEISTNSSRNKYHFLLIFFIIIFPDKALGFTVLGGTMFARGTGKDHWDEVMKNQKTHIQKWHKLRELVGTQNSLDLPKPGNRSRRGSSSTLNIPGTLGGATRQRSASVCSLISKK